MTVKPRGAEDSSEVAARSPSCQQARGHRGPTCRDPALKPVGGDDRGEWMVLRVRRRRHIGNSPPRAVSYAALPERFLLRSIARSAGALPAPAAPLSFAKGDGSAADRNRGGRRGGHADPAMASVVTSGDQQCQSAYPVEVPIKLDIVRSRLRCVEGHDDQTRPHPPDGVGGGHSDIVGTCRRGLYIGHLATRA